MTVLHLTISESEAGQRLDSALAVVAGITRSQARRWIDADRVRVNDRSCRASQSVQVGDDLDVTPPDLVKSALEPEAIALDVLYEDEDLIVIDKPAGMVVHPAPGHSSGTLVHALLHHCDNLAGIGGVERPGIVHRLDRGTSGVLVAAKCDEAHLRLAEQFHEHTIDRVYRAIVRGAPRADEGRVDRAIGRHPKDRKRMSVRGTAPREAQTVWRVTKRFPKSQRAALDIFPKPDEPIRSGFIWLRSGFPSSETASTDGPGIKQRVWRAPPCMRPLLVSSILAVVNRCGLRRRFQLI